MATRMERYTQMYFGATHADPEAAHKYMAELRKKRAKHKEATRKWDNAWDLLLAPVKAQIADLQKTHHRWQHFDYAYLYEDYLNILIKVRAKLQAAAQSAHLKGQTVQECAEEKGIKEFKGTRWIAWIPPHIREERRIAFDKVRLANPKKRLIVPWQTPTERSANEKRWLKLEEIMRNERLRYADHEYPLQLLTYAEERARARTALILAPVLWTHLLDKTTQAAFQKWKEETMDGLRDTARIDETT